MLWLACVLLALRSITSGYRVLFVEQPFVDRLGLWVAAVVDALCALAVLRAL